MGKKSQFRRTDNAAKRIERVTFKKSHDDYPDLSYLGEYSDSPKAVHIDRKERGDWRPGTYRYFNAGCGDPAYIEKDYERMQAYNDDQWCMVFCQCEAEVYIGGVSQTITSGGLGGVESDSGDYFNEIKKEELEALKGILMDMGFSERQVRMACNQCEDVEG